MTHQKTRAITIRLTDYSETSQVLAVFTRDFGRLSLIAKGSKRQKSPFQGAIDLLQLIDIVFVEKTGGQLGILTDSRLVDDFAGLRRNLCRGYSAFFVAELLLSLTEEHDPNAELFDLAQKTLAMLAESPRPSVVLNAFEVRFLTLIGYGARFDRCVWCEGALGGEEAAFAPEGGGPLCADCRGQFQERIYVSRGALAALDKLSRTDLKGLERLRVDGKIAQDVRKLLSRLWMHQLGHEPRMIRYLT